MSRPKNLEATLDGFQIGAISPGKLQIVMQAEDHSVTLKLTADEAAWLAHALNHWADVSKQTKLN